MKPSKNKVFCYDCGRNKMLFETEKKANTFLKFNADVIEEDEVCTKAGIGRDTSDHFSISYGPIGDVVEYPLPDLGSEELPNLHSSGSHTIFSLRINEVDISTANQVFSLRVTLYHPDLGTKYSIDIVSPINYP